MKVAELKEGMLVIPAKGKGWSPISLGPNYVQKHPSHMYMKTNNLKYAKMGRGPAIYMGKIKFDKVVHGLYTYHQLLYNGSIYLIDGYEFNGRIDPL